MRYGGAAPVISWEMRDWIWRERAATKLTGFKLRRPAIDCPQLLSAKESFDFACSTKITGSSESICALVRNRN